MAGLEDLPSLKKVIAEHGLMAKKSFGQHFLLDGRITDRIARTAGDLSLMHVIEIGPGPGGLTRSLLKAGAMHVHAVEKDARCLPILEDIKAHADGKLTIVHADATELDLPELTPAPRKIVANLPYNVGTALLVAWLDMIYRNPSAFVSLTLMFQKEVADRIVAEPGNKDFGRLTVLAQWLCECRHEFDLPPEAFSPPPKVNSSVVTLTPRSQPLVEVRKEALEKVMAAAFGQRRKMLKSALKSLDVNADTLLAKAGIMGSLRAEQLDVVTLCNLAKTYEGAIS